MASDVAPLPREPDTLIEMVLELRDENGKLRGMLETLRRALYGARSERFEGDAAQLALGLEDVSTAPVEPEPEVAKPRSQDGRTRATSEACPSTCRARMS
jgi:transposase